MNEAIARRQVRGSTELTVALVAAGCWLGAHAGVWLSFPGVSGATVFPPYAIVTAALLRTSRQQWPAVLLAATLGDFFAHRAGGAPLAFVLLTELVNHGRALLAAVGLTRFADRHGRLETTRGMLAYFVVAVGVAPCAAAFAGAGLAIWLRGAPDYWLAWRAWTLSNATTALTLLPLLTMSFARLRARLAGRRLAEGVLLLAGLVAVGAACFACPIAERAAEPARLYWPVPFLLWAAIRFGAEGTSAALAAVSALTVWGALRGRGPFHGESPTENLLQLQLFLLQFCVPMLLLSVVLEQRRALDEERRALDARRALEAAQREADRRKDEFLAMLGHELRNPLTPIGLAMEIVRAAAPDTPEATWARETVQRQLAHLTRLVDDLLDLSRISLGQVRLELAPLDLRAIVENAVQASEPAFRAAHRRVTVRVPDGTVVVRGDGVRLTQVVANLLNNAAKYTSPGGRAEVSVGVDGAFAAIWVRDDGVGIPRESLGEVFEMFRRLPSASDHATGGLGIGLTVVKRFVELHGGTVEAHSEGANQGTEIVVRLPLAATEIPTVAPPERAPWHDARSALKVLVVDDNADIAEGLASILRSWHHEVRTANDGRGALAAAGDFAADVVLVDLGLPDMDGEEVARLLRGVVTRAPRFLSMSGFEPARARRRSGAAGFHHHFLKPIDIDALRSLLEA